MIADNDSIRAVTWRDDCVHLLDQRVLPGQEHYLVLEHSDAVAEAIRDMVVRGAPAIGIAAAYAAVLAARRRFDESPQGWREPFESDLAKLQQARPTAVNLGWALQRMRDRAASLSGDPGPGLLAEAVAIHEEDIRANHAMGTLGAAFIDSGSGVLTHCNTGSLATGGYGTALDMIRSA